MKRSFLRRSVLYTIIGGVVLLMLCPFYRSIHPTSSTVNLPDILARGGLEIKVCVRTYRLFFVSHTEDFLLRATNKEEREISRKRVNYKNAKRRKWLEKYLAELDEERNSYQDVSRPRVPSPAVADTGTREEEGVWSARTQKPEVSPNGIGDTDRSMAS